MATQAIVALKHPDRAKARLSGSLTAKSRRELYFRMAEHVLKTLLQTSSIASVAVATASDEVAHFAQRLGASAIDLYVDLGTRAAYQQAIAIHRPRGELLLINGDLPFLQPEDIEMLSRHGDEIVIAPDRRDSGTNALWCRTPGVIEPLFGENSFKRHCNAARAAGVVPRVVKTLGLGFDVDDPQDLELIGHREVEQPRWLS
ncbi:2-phospho-L-lactate guanylyltransferase [Steroidobacter cummioxidans]|uniref:2-phospho-L-lactate guanylyltransferase n=1 Tax=Steroidobacter cummioxidans TaxID=1803913 RepID=UPI000E3129A1|nr:2-phospho-L-lactate guanylyltransferase [Steroidobacter cummioxidans]